MLQKKCEEYWPRSLSEPFVPSPKSSLVVKLKSSSQFPEFVVRKMIINEASTLILQQS